MGCSYGRLHLGHYYCPVIIEYHVNVHKNRLAIVYGIWDGTNAGMAAVRDPKHKRTHIAARYITREDEEEEEELVAYTAAYATATFAVRDLVIGKATQTNDVFVVKMIEESIEEGVVDGLAAAARGRLSTRGDGSVTRGGNPVPAVNVPTEKAGW